MLEFVKYPTRKLSHQQPQENQPTFLQGMWDIWATFTVKNKVAYKGKLMQVNKGIMCTHYKLAISFSRILHLSLSSWVPSQYTCNCAGNKNWAHPRPIGLLSRITRNWVKNRTFQNGEMGRACIKTKGSYKIRLCHKSLLMSFMAHYVAGILDKLKITKATLPLQGELSAPKESKMVATWLINSTPPYLLKGHENVHTMMCMQMFTALFVIAQKCKDPNIHQLMKT